MRGSGRGPSLLESADARIAISHSKRPAINMPEQLPRILATRHDCDKGFASSLPSPGIGPMLTICHGLISAWVRCFEEWNAMLAGFAPVDRTRMRPSIILSDSLPAIFTIGLNTSRCKMVDPNPANFPPRWIPWLPTRREIHDPCKS
ncbi:uncharacterized protein BO72DRAFT_495333 [Aspergillus fijiensis CBS 313.89]|uniref:Uncharacterized protein n=1 Tax=Aspergillus fijiensis CBS 313.89 TaxID=1448319 RepID=A0A8G1VYX3_9EURO|nr:uncharacterized protein BO72DRAFT_495333 [Aspergillus fijiensis CBS 313.89]RAK78180.1 hypothetical protein BO72DRAFT_495333 [Aspergillus fijiensis CBS 313.89]